MKTCTFKAVSVVVMALGSALGACASAGSAGSAGAPVAAAPTTITGAELSSSEGAVPSAREASPAAAAESAPASGPAPGGKLVCRTTNCVDGTTELYLDWNGKVASGTIKRTAPSGMVYEQPVRAERYQGTIVVDEPSCTDLATHAAMVVEQHGKLHMRVGPPGSAVTACE